MIYIKKIINQLTTKAFGIEKIIDKIYVFNNTENENLNKIYLYFWGFTF